MTDERAQQRLSFLAQQGFAGARIEALPADASFRRYFRLHDGPRPALLMDSPPDKLDVRPFVTVATHLRRLGLSAPDPFAVDAVLGLVLVEDFGDATFTNLLANGADERALYALAVDALVQLQRAPDATAVTVPPYNRALLLTEASLLVEWFWPAHHGAIADPLVLESWRAAWDAVFDALPPGPTTLVLRDYHVDNLMRLDGRDGVAACGLLDFQDSLLGSPAYDLVSLLDDIRRDVSDAVVVEMRARYGAALSPAPGFDAWYAALGAQRLSKILGLFVRLAVRDGKHGYLRHLPRGTRLLARQLETPILAPVACWFDTNFPDWQRSLEVDAAMLASLLVAPRPAA
ncbi:aminoglycoside phosphotransferase family protein [Roseiterribacter gracilis]|uniref:Aminoglycoside phosphotransferase n=1 Tax=Roseiterribacter gracilis TaxID=2812848 RepID=A0A8S8XD20_9PROT|nr:aminoglycoside phosphotransferase [Rhodospirillales bacterium TMPK1]